jgi:hypothetical protein
LCRFISRSGHRAVYERVKSQIGVTRGHGLHEMVRETSTLTEYATVHAALLSEVTGAERAMHKHVALLT